MAKKWMALLLSLGMLLALSGCGGEMIGVFVTGGNGSESAELTPEQAVAQVRTLLEENSSKLCPNDAGLQALAALELEAAGETSVNGEACYVVLGGSSSFALRKDGAVLYEWEPVSGSYALVTEGEADAVPALPEGRD